MVEMVQSNIEYIHFNYLPIGVIIIDQNRKVLFWNQVCENLTGIQIEQSYNELLTNIFPSFEKQPYLNLLNSVFSDKKIVVLSSDLHPTAMHTQYNHNKVLHTVISPMPNEQGEINALLSIQDQTSLKNLVSNNRKLNNELQKSNVLLEKKVLERTRDLEATIKLQVETRKELLKRNIELKSAKERSEESDRLKSEFLHNMSHEVRTPMNGIMGFSQFLDDPDVNASQRSYYTKIIQNSCQQLLHIIDDILEISILETRQVDSILEVINLNELLMEIYSIFELKISEKNIEFFLNKHLKDNEAFIRCDRGKLQKVLNNLIENAFKYTLEGFIEFGYTIEQTTLKIYIKDTGVGIDKQNQEKIFDRFVQEEKDLAKKTGGLGLGLSIAKENTELLGGKITVKSEKNVGSEFWIELPFMPVLDINSDVNEDTPMNISKNLSFKVLIAEDESVNFLYLEEMLQNISEFNIQVIHAKNGKEAIDFCMEHRDLDLILMDIKMPILNGKEATKKIRDILPNIPIIAQTAYSTKIEKEDALNHGCNDFISKPIDKTDFYNLIRSYLLK